MLVKEVIQEVTELCRKHSVKKMILFGSRAKSIIKRGYQSVWKENL